MSTPPIAKEPEVTGLSEVREKLERITMAHENIRGDECRSIALESVYDLAREALALMESEQGEQKPERRFPILDTDQGSTIPWSVAEQAYLKYAQRYPGQSLQQLANRGGFGEKELDGFLPGWREMAWPSAQMCRDHKAMEKMRTVHPGAFWTWDVAAEEGYALVGAWGSVGSAITKYTDPTDAILGTESENGGDK